MYLPEVRCFSVIGCKISSLKMGKVSGRGRTRHASSPASSSLLTQGRSAKVGASLVSIETGLRLRYKSNISSNPSGNLSLDCPTNPPARNLVPAHSFLSRWLLLTTDWQRFPPGPECPLAHRWGQDGSISDDYEACKAIVCSSLPFKGMAQRVLDVTVTGIEWVRLNCFGGKGER